MLAVGVTSVPTTAHAVSPETVNLGSAASFATLAHGYIVTGANMTFNGNAASGDYVTTGATNTINGSTYSGAATTVGATNTINGDLYSGAAITLGDGATVSGTPFLSPGANYTDATSFYSAAVSSLDAAKTDIGDRAFTALTSGELGGTTLRPGVHHSVAALGLTGTLTLDAEGDPNAIFIIKSNGALVTAASSKVVLANQAQAKNVFWSPASYYTAGASSIFKGNVLATTYISIGDQASMEGRLMSQTSYVSFGVGGPSSVFGIPGIGTPGIGTPSVPTSTAPGAPTIGAVTAGNAQATVSWTAPGSDGGDAITGYTVTSSGGQTATTTGATSVVVSTLNNGTAYTFTVTATNGIGTSAASATSASVTPTTGSTAPGAPTIGAVTAGNAQATVSWTAPGSDGGDAITGYTVTSSGGQTATTTGATSVVVSTLNNGTAYTFTVTATNGIGTSAASATSASVTPTTGTTAPPVSAPPVSAPPVSAPPVSAPPVSAPPVSAPPVSAPPVSAPSAVVIDTPGQPTDTTTAGIANTPPTFLASLPPAGGATGSLDGRAAPLVVIDNKKAGRIKVSGKNYEITIRPTSPSGGKLKLNSEGVGILKAGGKIASRGFGFLPSTKIDFYLIRGKVADFIGNLDVLADGTYDGAVPIPSSLSSGTYTLQVSGLTKQMKIRSVATLTRSVSVRVKIVETVKTVPTRYFSRGGKVYFKAYSSELSESAKRKLDTLVKKLPNKKSNLVRVTGLVGPGGSIGHVKALSKERAKTVARYLRAKDVRGKYVLKSGGNATGGSSSAQRAKVKITPIKGK